ncbi:MAG: hypothetical protein JRN10_07685 [Nitrososphaerota archaeon]|nr:hypothetical protein [Nitrososphaerota archaeon]
MCDTLVSRQRNNTDSSVTYFAKNSDREPDELQLVEYYPRIGRKGSVRCTYMDVKFEGETNAIIISRPRWMWGAEMGVNEHGVAIGNEAVFTRRKFDRAGLLGMDLLRLGLESGTNAKEAMSTIIQYLEEYGQGGSNSSRKKEYYDNSFLISDWDESYVLETFEKKWWYSRIDRFGSISNAPFAGRKGARLDVIYTFLGRGRERARTTGRSLAAGNMDPDKIMDIMRIHNEANFSPGNGSNRDICMHAGRFTRRFQTVNSMMLEIGPGYVLPWFTFSPNPCVSLYKPLFFGPGTVWWGRDYWENAKGIHDALSTRGREAYGKAIKETVKSQSLVNEIVKEARNRMAMGEMLEENYVIAIYEKVKAVDTSHLQALKQLL